MDKLLDRVGGLDVHRDTVVACVRTPGPDGQRQKKVVTFGAMTADLLALRDWLKAHGVTHVAMESTGVFWKPVYYVLEEEFTILLVNAAHMKNVPGRKTDVKDSEWIADLLEHGLLRGSFVPPKPIRDLRDLTRYRSTVTHLRGEEVQRLQKLLQDAGIKLTSVATDVMGVSGRAMLDALIKGTTDPAVLAELAKGRLRKKLPVLRQALQGRFRDHHAFLVTQILAHIDYLEETVEDLTQQIEERLRPFAEQVEILKTIPGVGSKTAQVLVAEIGVDMKRFPTAGHLASWAGLCPGNNESAGKHKSGRTRNGDNWLRTALVESALTAMRDTQSYFSAHYRRIARRRGHKKAIIAVAHSILVIAYHLLRKGTKYEDLGHDYFQKREKDAIQSRCVKQLEKLGFKVDLTQINDPPKEDAA